MGRLYIRGMDGLRAVGVLCVLIAHFWPRPNTMLDYFHFGRFGVVLFFVLSGFLVVKSLMSLREDIDLERITSAGAIRTFYYRRALRIFPIYYLSLLIVYFFQATPSINDHIHWLILYVSNYAVWSDFNLVNTEHFWTLAVEEQFYLLAPFFVIFVNKKFFLKTFTLILMCGLIIKGVDFYWREINGEVYLFNKVTHPLWGCLEGLCFGAMLAHAGSDSQFSNFFAQRNFFIFSFLLVIAMSVYRYINMDFINQDIIYAVFAHTPYALLSLAAVCSILKSPNSLLVNMLECFPVRWIGRISYGVYIFHYLAKPFIAKWVSSIDIFFPVFVKPYALFVIGSMVSIVMASLSFIFIEKPIMSLRGNRKGLIPMVRLVGNSK